jgi:hypothetical protein
MSEDINREQSHSEILIERGDDIIIGKGIAGGEKEEGVKSINGPRNKGDKFSRFSSVQAKG